MVLDQGLEGWMEKQGGGHMSKAWKERFFILRNGVLRLVYLFIVYSVFLFYLFIVVGCKCFSLLLFE